MNTIKPFAPYVAPSSQGRRGFLFKATRSAAVALAVLLLLSGAADAPQALATTAAATDLTPTDRERRVGKLVGAVIERQHYRQQPINDQVSSKVLDRFIETLDGQRSYFLQRDIAEFERYRFQLDDAVVGGALEPVFAIYNRWQQRSRERLQFAIDQLKTEPNFAVDESFEFDRSKSPWAKTADELDEIWRKRVKNDALSLVLADKQWPDVADTLRKRYERVQKRTEQTNNNDIFEVFLNSFAHEFDPHSNYFSPRNSEEYRIQMSLSYEGIGASLRTEDDYVVVQQLLPGGPAAISGILNVNDRIVAVGEGKTGKMVDVIGWRLDDVVQLIRGKINTVVRLQILPAGAAPGSTEKTLEFTRNKVIMELSAAKKEMRKVTRDGREFKVGVINVPSFYQDFDARSKGDTDYRSTTRDVRKLIDQLKAEGMDSLVVDLRGNGGGHLTEATGLTGLFIPTGPVVQLRETGGRIEVLDDTESDVAWSGPLVVLVDRFSASASEIFAAAIQDYGRGVVVGQRTFGKGTVQNLIPLDRYTVGQDAAFGQLTVTIGKFYRITGESTQHRGVEPDISLPSPIDPTEIGESSQPSALPWDRIHGVPFGKDGNIKQAIAPLTKAHDARVLTDADYQVLLKEIGLFETARSQKAVSLDVKKRQSERTQLDQQRLSIENERRKQLGIEPLKALTDAPTNEQRDPVLAETAQIALDLSAYGKTTLARSGASNAQDGSNGERPRAQ